MYGAVLRPDTELTKNGQAHMGVLFLTNEGYSTMCGHATLAVARLLVDCSASKASAATEMPGLKVTGELDYDEEKQEVLVRLHAPCGLVHVSVPVALSAGHRRTDASRPISYIGVPSYATGVSVEIDVPQDSNFTWAELGRHSSKPDSVVVGIAYGGAFYIIASAKALGFESLSSANLQALGEAARKLKAVFNRPEAETLRQKYLVHPEHQDLQFLYGVIVTDADEDHVNNSGTETSICFFADRQVDRSPTGSGVQARVALAYAKGERKLEARCTYHSPVSRAFGEGAFIGEAMEEVDIGGGIKGVTVKVSGYARYTGCCNFIVERGDTIGKGFCFDELGG